jgi:hypothetical protein
MKNFVKFLGIIILTVVIGFSMAACDDGGGGGSSGGGGDGDNEGVSLPQNSGTNEVIGKTLNLGKIIVFANSGTSFEDYRGEMGYKDDSGKWVYIPSLFGKGSYSYNSENKTITLAVEQIYEMSFEKWMNKTQLKKEKEEQFDARIASIRSNFDDMVLRHAAMVLPIWDDYWGDYYAGSDDEYTFLKQWLTQKGYNTTTLISQWKSENPSVNTPDKYINATLAMEGYKNLAEAKADYISYFDEMFAPITYEYQFTTDNALLVQEKLPTNKGSNELQGKSFTNFVGSDVSYKFEIKDTYKEEDSWWPTSYQGTYAYNSNTKKVWLKPEKIDGQTMLEYYSSRSWGADDKAGDTNTNSAFRTDWYKYGLNPNWLKEASGVVPFLPTLLPF